MTIDEAIEYHIKAATQRAIADEEMGVNDNSKWNETKFMTKKESEQIIADNRQLAEWLKELKELRSIIDACNILAVDAFAVEKLCKELKEAKRLLKMAVEDLNATVAEVYNGGVICECCKWESQIGECCCPNDGGCDTDYRWRYADEALKLLNDEK